MMICQGYAPLKYVTWHKGISTKLSLQALLLNLTHTNIYTIWQNTFAVKKFGTFFEVS